MSYHELQESKALYGNSIRKLKFIVDAQLPKKLSDFLNNKGFSSIHTLELPNKNATTDRDIKEMACAENLILITKDDDFLHSFLIEQKPAKLILVKTGNINNTLLIEIFSKQLLTIFTLIEKHNLIEISVKEIIVHS